ncbi:PDZ domain-containing protein [Actomonas aquatica]|uniref:PDZ domain-containing protein n=1 Tax=Actomonas aquatica TaxID=2866162 RepID=A0ABZ1C8T3_9BACT|nr:PDZ domain-containing protein [Opitutus sp. WL0086]WRQ88106.1 PDZ domain-containing protein [Opitutus sp. WL0086]
MILSHPRLHRVRVIFGVVAAAFALSSAVDAAEPSLADMMEERLASTVAVQFTIEHEMDRTVNYAYGLVIDREGTIILESGAISERATPEQLVDFRVHRPDAPTTVYSKAEYLGQDAFTSWHFIRVEPEGRSGLRPITDFLPPEGQVIPEVAEQVWGIGLRKKDEDYRPYFLSDRISMITELPQMTAIALGDVAGRCLPVFNMAGEFVGVGVSGFGESRVIYSQRRRGEMSVMVNPDETGAFRLASEVLLAVDRVPTNPYGRPMPWFGVDGVDPVDPEVAEFLGLDGGTGLVISEVLAGSPAEDAGLLPRDIIVALDGLPLPRLKPDQVVVVYLQRDILRRLPGSQMTLSVLRNREEIDLPLTLGDAPKTPNEAERQYYEGLGLTVREIVYSDAVDRRADPTDLHGVIAHFVKPSSPVATAGLQFDDWIQEIDGRPVTTFADATEIIDDVAESGRPEVVMLVSRNGETAVLRVKLN